MKQSNIIKDQKQTRTTIPKEFVDKHNITKKDKMEWGDEDGKLKGVLKKDDRE